jgi:hypothetical protein
LSQRLLAWGVALAGNFLSRSVLAGKCENWHVKLSSTDGR